MAKKSTRKRKQRKTNIPVYTVPTADKEKTAASQAVAAQAPISNPLASKNATTEQVNWPQEYPFYGPDMKRLGVIVALMVILLLALNVVFIYVL